MTATLPTLTIVIPALNEEAAIGRTIQRCLDAEDVIRQRGRIGAIEIIVVSDGSTDRTPQIAAEFRDRHPQVRLIVFEQNRGYGAAIKTGFATGTGELVSFLDADGTCDPQFFGELCAAIQSERADIALGDRMGPTSRMPRVRRLGNRLFAFLLGFLSGEAVTDTASGMRVLWRRGLDDIYPLPDGLDFTPAMSARAVMQGLRVVEVPMEYAERIGESKLRAIKDGFRFLRAILDAVLFFRPTRLYSLACTVCALVVLLLAASPTEFYLRHRALEEWMLYRFALCLLLTSGGFTLLCTSVVADDLFFLTRQRRRQSFSGRLLSRLCSTPVLLTLAALLIASSFVLVWPGLKEYALTQHVTLHWSRVLAAALGLLLALQCVITTSLRRIVALWRGYLADSTALP